MDPCELVWVLGEKTQPTNDVSWVWCGLGFEMGFDGGGFFLKK